jgi:hypothetical protein
MATSREREEYRLYVKPNLFRRVDPACAVYMERLSTHWPSPSEGRTSVIGEHLSVYVGERRKRPFAIEKYDSGRPYTRTLRRGQDGTRERASDGSSDQIVMSPLRTTTTHILKSSRCTLSVSTARTTSQKGLLVITQRGSDIGSH